jgi:hypothetical protein
MIKPNTLSEPAVKVLSWLLDLAAQRAGYTVRGAEGWASAEQIEAGVKTWGTAELMRAELERIVSTPGLSKDVFEQASKSLI